jgi:hypothetical protein
LVKVACLTGLIFAPVVWAVVEVLISKKEKAANVHRASSRS